MTTHQQFAATIALASALPTGTVVYCRASGKRGTVAAYQTYSDGSARVLVNYTYNGGYECCLRCTLSTTPVPPYDEGDEWKQTS